MKAFLQRLLSTIKPYLRWFILGGTLFFLAKALKDRWQEVLQIRIESWGWGYLAIALTLTLIAHIWSGWVWGWILWEFKQKVSAIWSIETYLITNIGKYLPGNVWHFYGRIRAAETVGISRAIAIISTLLEPLLMAASALVLAGVASPQSRGILPLVILSAVLIGIHPKFLNPVVQKLAKKKQKRREQESDEERVQLTHYPWRPLLGELGFLLIRGLGFLWAIAALTPVEMSSIPLLLSAFSFAWLLGLVVPGAPGGLGVFEATAIALLDSTYEPAIILSTVALYRVISILAEAIGALLAWIWQKRWKNSPHN